MKVSEIKDAILPAVVARKCFIVDINVSADNDIVLTIESEEGTVVLDDCVELSHAFEEHFDREVEDYSLTVTSAGLDQPFKVLKQYQKAIGTKATGSRRCSRQWTRPASLWNTRWYARSKAARRKKRLCSRRPSLWTG